MSNQRVVSFRPRAVLVVLLIVLAVAAALEVVWIARGVVTWIVIALFLALALNPAVEWLLLHGVKRRGTAVAITVFGALLVLVGIGAIFVPTIVDQVNEFVDAIPGYVDDLTKGRGRLGFLETKYHVVERVKDAVHSGGARKLLGLSGTAVSVTKGIITIIVASLTIFVMVIFMLLEGPAWMERFYGLLPPDKQARWRAVGHDIYRTVGGYVTGNLVISLIAGVSSTIVLLVMGVPFAVALGLVVAILDLIPLAGATIAAVIVSSVAFLHSIPAGIVVLLFFIVYQQVENHFLQPVIYGRTVQLSPLAVLISVLVGAQLAGILGALAAIPVAGSIQVILRDWLARRPAPASALGDPAGAAPPAT
jgi:predicted PurR-regulated permease PerM